MTLNVIPFRRLRILIILFYTNNSLTFQCLSKKLNYNMRMNIINAQFGEVGRHLHNASPLIVQPIWMEKTSTYKGRERKRRVRLTESEWQLGRQSNTDGRTIKLLLQSNTSIGHLMGDHEEGTDTSPGGYNEEKKRWQRTEIIGSRLFL
jgi:hypothetical protein